MIRNLLLSQSIIFNVLDKVKLMNSISKNKVGLLTWNRSIYELPLPEI